MKYSWEDEFVGQVQAVALGDLLVLDRELKLERSHQIKFEHDKTLELRGVRECRAKVEQYIYDEGADSRAHQVRASVIDLKKQIKTSTGDLAFEDRDFSFEAEGRSWQELDNILAGVEATVSRELQWVRDRIREQSRRRAIVNSERARRRTAGPTPISLDSTNDTRPREVAKGEEPINSRPYEYEGVRRFTIKDGKRKRWPGNTIWMRIGPWIYNMYAKFSQKDESENEIVEGIQKRIDEEILLASKAGADDRHQTRSIGAFLSGKGRTGKDFGRRDLDRVIEGHVEGRFTRGPEEQA